MTQDLGNRLRQIAQDVSSRWAVTNAVIYHNLDDLPAGTLVTHVVVSGEHRSEAFDAAREIIERIKSDIHVDSLETYERS